MRNSDEKYINSMLWLLTVIFVILKLAGQIDWGWLWVFSPLWILWAVVASFVILIIVGILAILAILLVVSSLANLLK